MILPLILLFVGLVLVVKGADFLVDGASSLAKRLKIPEMVIGLTIVAIGTSNPELVFNVFSSIAGKSEMVLGNVTSIIHKCLKKIFKYFIIKKHGGKK